MRLPPGGREHSFPGLPGPKGGCARRRAGGNAASLQKLRFCTWFPGLPGPDPGHFFHGEKVPKTPPGTPRSPIFCPIGLYQWGNFSATELGFCHLIYSGSIDDASADALLKRYMFR